MCCRHYSIQKLTGSSIWRSWGEMWRRNINTAKQGTQTWLISHSGRDIFGSFWRFFLCFFDESESMPGRRCVVQDCGNIKNDELGISIHNSPDSGSVRLKWKRFVSIHRKDSSQWENLLCAPSISQGIVLRLLFRWKAWKESWRRGRFQLFEKNPLKHYQSGVDDRWVSMYLRCAYHHNIYFLTYLWHDFSFWHRCSIFV